jgi:hypothetical protein
MVSHNKTHVSQRKHNDPYGNMYFLFIQFSSFLNSELKQSLFPFCKEGRRQGEKGQKEGRRDGKIRRERGRKRGRKERREEERKEEGKEGNQKTNKITHCLYF